MKEYEELIEQIEYKISTKQCTSEEVEVMLKSFKENPTQELYDELRNKYYSVICQCSFPSLENFVK